MKRFVQVFAFIAFAYFISAVPATAQARYVVDAEVSFGFIVGDQAYDPGKFVLKIQPTSSGSAIVTISDKIDGTTQTLLATETGATSGSAGPQLVFETQNGVRVLTGIALPDRGLALRSVDVNKVTLTRITGGESSTIKKG